MTASILIDDLRVGDTLDVEYSTFGENPVFGGKFIGVAGWDQIYPTLRRRIVLNHPVDRHPTWHVVADRGAADITPKETIQNGVRRLEFDQLALPGTPVEALTSPDFFTFRFIQFSEFGSWNEVAHWATDLFEGKPDITDELRTVVERIRALGSDEARVVSALEFVQTQIRYFSVSLGESSHRPSPPDAVLRRRYGDCKDKSLLLMTLLRELGIESKPVLLQLGRRAGLDKTIPSPQFFNHVIVQAVVGGKTYFLDPTRLGQHGQLDRMGQMPKARRYWWWRATPRPCQIPAGNADTIADEVSERGTLTRFGEPGQLDVRHVWHGVRAEGLRLLLERAPREQVVKIVGDGMERRYPGASIAGDPTITDDRASNEFSIAASYKVPKLATEVDGNWVVTFAPDNLQNVLTGSPSANRTTPLRIPGFPFHGKYQFEMVFPEQVSASIDPREQAIANNAFSATVTDYFRGQRCPQVDRSEDAARFRGDLGLPGFRGGFPLAQQGHRQRLFRQQGHLRRDRCRIVQGGFGAPFARPGAGGDQKDNRDHQRGKAGRIRSRERLLPARRRTGQPWSAGRSPAGCQQCRTDRTKRDLAFVPRRDL